MPPRKPSQPTSEPATDPVPVVREIQVTRAFRGVETKERLIPEGRYPENDKRLFGLGAILIERGFAEWV